MYTFKHTMDNGAIFMGKSIFLESMENLSTNKTATFARFVSLNGFLYFQFGLSGSEVDFV